MSLLTQTAPIAAPASHPSAEATPGSSAAPPAPAQRPAHPRRRVPYDHTLSPLSAHARAARIHEQPPQPATTLAIPTPHGPAHGLWRPSSQRHAAVLLLPEADNLLGGPDGLFDALAPMLQRAGAVAQLAYPRPGDLDACRDALLAALDALNRCGIERVALIGWGFGAAVATSVAASCPLVTGLACLTSDHPITDAGEANASADSDRDGAGAALRPLLITSVGWTEPATATPDMFLPHADTANLGAGVLATAALHARARERDALLQRLARWASATLRSPFRPARHSLALNGALHGR